MGYTIIILDFFVLVIPNIIIIYVTLTPLNIQLTSDKKVRLTKLRTALKANCIVLKREYKLAKTLKNDDNLKKILNEAFAVCKEGFEQVKKRSSVMQTKRIKKLLDKTNKIYKDALKDEDQNNACITLLTNTKKLIRTMTSAFKILQSEKTDSKYMPDKKLQSKFRDTGKTAISLNRKMTGPCRRIKRHKQSGTENKIKKLLKDERMLGNVQKDSNEKEFTKTILFDADNPFQAIEGKVMVTKI